jgi:4'-phosphopantetheinyl transferase
MPSSLPVVAVRVAATTDPVVRLWQASLEHPSWSEVLPLLSDEELRRVDRFVFECDARRYAVSRAVLRTLLGRIIEVEPEEVALGTEAGGRPFLRNSGALHFSLSRSDERVLIGVASRPLGVDLESLAAPIDAEALAEVVFSHAERLEFEQIRPETRREILLRCWTWKEAIFKAAGHGLSIPPTAARVLLSSSFVMTERATVVCLGSRWQVISILPQLGFVGAVASEAIHET